METIRTTQPDLQSGNRETVRYTRFGILFGLAFPVVATLIRSALGESPWSLAAMVEAQATDPLLWIIDTAPLFLGLFARAGGIRQDRANNLNRELAQRGRELEQARAALAGQVEARTRDLVVANEQLERRTRRLDSIAQLSQAIVQMQDPRELLESVPALVSERLGYYHVGLFFADEDGRYVTLRAANSEGGRRMLAAGHRLRVGVTGIVGHVAKYGEPRVALDVGADPAFFNNPDLPETRSEVALPLVAAERILGVLDIQSTESGAFDVEEVEALRVLTNQLAIAYQNAVQLAEARMALASLRQAGPRELELMAHGGQAPAYTATPDGRVERAPAEATVVPEAGSAEGAAWTQQTVDEGGRPTVLVPVTLRGELIGAIRVQSENVNRRWTANEIHLLESVAGRAATALENAGLLSRSERLAETQRAIGEIATNIGSSTRFDAILQTAARELSKALGGSEVMVQIEPRTVGATPRPESGS